MNLRYPVNTKGLLLKLPIEDFQYLNRNTLNGFIGYKKVPVHEKLVGGGYLNEQTLWIGLTLTQRKCQLY